MDSPMKAIRMKLRDIDMSLEVIIVGRPEITIDTVVWVAEVVTGIGRTSLDEIRETPVENGLAFISDVNPNFGCFFEVTDFEKYKDTRCEIGSLDDQFGGVIFESVTGAMSLERIRDQFERYSRWETFAGVMFKSPRTVGRRGFRVWKT